MSERTLKIRWSGINISKSRFDSEECDELEEIFGAKLHKYNRSKMHQVLFNNDNNNNNNNNNDNNNNNKYNNISIISNKIRNKSKL